MPPDVANSEEFDRLLESLSDDVVHAQVHYKLFRDLRDSIDEYETEFNQSWTFWSLTLQAHKEAFLVRLCRVYDQEKSALHLYNWLRTIQDNLHLFETEEFRERLQDNEFVDSLSERTRKPDPDQLKEDLEKVDDSDPLVKKIMIWRNNLFAHRSATGAVRDINFFEEHPMKYSEVETLLDRAVTILNRYSRLFKATLFSSQIVGHDDYEFVLKSIRSKLAIQEEKMREELKQTNRS